METAMTDSASPFSTAERSPPKGQFYGISPDIRGGGDGHGLELANEDALARPPNLTVDPPTGDPNQYPEKPHLVYSPTRGDMPRDLEGWAGLWIVSERLKQVFEATDHEGFAFTACDFTLADGSPGPQYYLCNVVRTLDALNEEESEVRIKHEPSGRKIYSFRGGARLAFRAEVIGLSHVFRTPYSRDVFCDALLRDACKAAGLTGLWFVDAADY